MSTTPDFWPAAPDLQCDEVSFEFQGNEYRGSLVAPSAHVGPRPLVLVIHNYQGLKFFDQNVAEYIARLGYVGLAIDLYGNLITEEDRLWPADTSKVPEHLIRSFEAMVSLDHDHGAFRALLNQWIEQGLAHPLVDSSVLPAAIGYCFGGVAVLEAVRAGLNLSGVVSFHGLQQTGEDASPANVGVVRPTLKPCTNQYNTKTLVLIENGADDHLVPQESRTRFFAEMDGAGVDWCFHHYARTPHGFALPASIARIIHEGNGFYGNCGEEGWTNIVKDIAVAMS